MTSSRAGPAPHNDPAGLPKRAQFRNRLGRRSESANGTGWLCEAGRILERAGYPKRGRFWNCSLTCTRTQICTRARMRARSRASRGSFMPPDRIAGTSQRVRRDARSVQGSAARCAVPFIRARLPPSALPECKVNGLLRAVKKYLHAARNRVAYAYRQRRLCRGRGRRRFHRLRESHNAPLSFRFVRYASRHRLRGKQRRDARLCARPARDSARFPVAASCRLQHRLTIH